MTPLTPGEEGIRAARLERPLNTVHGDNRDCPQVVAGEWAYCHGHQSPTEAQYEALARFCEQFMVESKATDLYDLLTGNLPVEKLVVIANEQLDEESRLKPKPR